MSRMKCLCGGTISDSHDPCHTEGWILRDEDVTDYFVASASAVSSFFEAVLSGKRDEWLLNNFSSVYPLDLSHQEVLSDILLRSLIPYRLSICECSQCGRLYVQRAPNQNSYSSYAPDQHGYAGILRAVKGEAPPA